MTTAAPANWTVIPHLPPGPEGRVRFSREAYHRMFETGMLDQEKRYELIDGVIVAPMVVPQCQLDLGWLFR
jgi:hypothetical protein